MVYKKQLKLVIVCNFSIRVRPGFGVQKRAPQLAPQLKIKNLCNPQGSRGLEDLSVHLTDQLSNFRIIPDYLKVVDFIEDTKDLV